MTITYNSLVEYSDEELLEIQGLIAKIQLERRKADFEEKKEAFEKAFKALQEIGARVYDAGYGDSEEIHEFDIAM